MKRILYTLLLLLAPLAGSAQDYTFYTTENGLSSSLIRQIYEDSAAMMWIATEDGLNRFDGNKMVRYTCDPDDPHSIGSDYITSIYEDSKGHLFIASHAGVQLYDRDTDRFSAPARFADGGGPSGQVNSVWELSGGELFAIGNNLASISVKDTVPSLAPLGFSSTMNYSSFVREDSERNIWIVKARRAIYRIAPDGTTTSYIDDTGYNVLDMYITPDDEIYIVAINGGLLRYDRSRDDFVSIPYPGPDAFAPRCIAPFSGGSLLIGTDGSGVKIYNPATGKFSNFSQVDGRYDLTRLKVHSIERDREGNLWLGIYQKGVVVVPFRRNNFKYFGFRSYVNNRIGSCAVSALCRTDDGTMWVGTDNDGLYGISQDGQTVRHFTHDGTGHSVPATVTGLFEDSAGNLWLSSFDSSVGILDRRSGRCRYVDFSSLRSTIAKHITAFAEDDNGRVWIATMGSGLLCYDLRTRSFTDLSPVLREVPLYITCMIWADGSLFMGTYDGACRLKLDGGTVFTSITDDNIIHTVNRQNDGSIAFGCENGLLIWKSDGSTRLYSEKDGLPTSTVYSVLQDSDGLTWLGTGYGLSRLGPDYKVQITFYTEDGIQGNEFTRNASWRDSDGTLWFGGTSGLTYFRPSEIVSPLKKWTVRFTDLYLHNRSVTKGTKSGKYQVLNSVIYEADKIDLSHLDNAFTLLFATVEKGAPQRLRYMYRMDRENWTSLPQGTSRLSFSSLPVGEHRLYLKARDAFMESDVVSLGINIHPPFWATPLAKFLYVLLALAICTGVGAWLLAHYRSKQKLKEYEMSDRINEAKLQFFVNISHELKNPLSMIINPLRKLMSSEGSPEERQRNYRIMYRNTEKLLQLMNQLLDVRKIDKGGLKLHFSENDVVPFISNIVDNMSGQFSQKNIALTFSHPGLDSLRLWFDPTNLDKVIINLLSNAFKFTPVNGKVKILLETARRDGKDMARISVIDNGIGIAPEELENIFKRFYQARGGQSVYKGGTGVGLDLVRSLVELHSGEVHAENNPDGTGARFMVTLPLGREHLSDEQIAPAEVEVPAVKPAEAPVVLPEAITIPEEGGHSTPKTKYRLMLVDDDSELRSYVAEELSQDFHIIQCSNGKEALDSVFESRPDIIVSDVVMPVMDGITLCDKIRQNINLNHIPFVMLTGKSKDEDNIAGLKSGADAYIAKPFNIEVLKATILNLVRTRRILRNNYAGQQSHDDKISKPEIRTPDDKLMERILRVLNENMGNSELTIEMLAQQVGISRVHLHRKLKELTNQTTSDFIRNTRLAQAAKLLGEGKQSIGEVAALVGFENPANFATAFKKLYGVSPREYMNNQTATCSKD